MSGTEEYLMVGAFVLIGGFVFVLGFFKMRKYRIIKDTPRSKIRSMAMGIVEIHGHVEADQLIKSPFSKTDCVYYKYEIKEYRKQSSSKGKSTSYRWVTVNSGDKRVPFFACDETGRALVNPDRAEINVSFKRAYYQKGKGIFGSIAAFGKIIKALKDFDPNDPMALDVEGLELEPMESRTGLQSTRPGDRKYLEYYIETGDTLFVLGTAAHDPEAPDKVIIKRGRNEKTFIICDKEEKKILKDMKKLMIVCFVIGGLFFAAGIVMLFQILNIIPRG